MSWRQWLHGLCAALIGSLAAVTGAVVVAAQQDYDVLDASFWHVIAGAVGASALTSVGFYVKQFPPPGTLAELRPQEKPNATRP